MPDIRILPDVLASQVAAGEVVERPASVIKELVENSLDAGAGEILVEIQRGGAALMRVGDDGCGMSREDALLSLERHATSKLRQAADLQRVTTLGFRGEAVPSIASVSRFTMVTRRAEALVGTEIRVDGGRVAEVRDAGCAVGTRIETRDLFFNLPARRKFLRTENTEAAHIEHQLRQHALAACEVRLRYLRDGREVFDLPPGMSRLERVRWMLGTALARDLITLPGAAGDGFRLDGFILPANHARRGRRHQCVFLNGRPVEDGAISRGLSEGFRGAVAEGRHPAAWLWIEMSPTLVDVNVHPAKREIRLHRPHDLREAIADAVRRGLESGRARTVVAPQPTSTRQNRSGPTETVETAERGQPPKSIESGRGVEPPPAPVEPRRAVAQELPLSTTGPRRSVQVPDFRLLGELHGRFALFESADGLVLFDPRAARERILYERWLATASEAVETQGLLVPQVFEPGPREAALLLGHRDLFQQAGFELGDFGSGSIRLDCVPAFLSDRAPEQLLIECVADLEDGGRGRARFALERIAAALARQAARREAPQPGEACVLLEQLFQCELPYCAADGRPILSEFSMSELERRLAR